MWLRPLLALSVVLLSAHVTTVCLGHVRVYLLVPGVATSLASLAVALPSGSWTDPFRSGIHYHVVYALVAWGVRALDVYCLAYALCALITACVDLAHARGLVAYDPTTSYFVITRSSLYALLRTLSHVLVREVAVFPIAVEYLVPVGVATLETLGMYVRTSAYTFSQTSVTFAVYAVVKSGLFLALPVVETYVRS